MSGPRLTSTTALTDEAGQILEPLLPPENTGGRPRKSPMREVLTGIQAIWRAGWAWRLRPHALPHGPTASQTWRPWRREGPWRRMPDQLRAAVRTRMGRHPQPSAAIREAPTVNTTDHGGALVRLARSNAPAASALASLRRRGSSGGSSSMPPTGEMRTWRPGGAPPPPPSSSGGRTSGRTWPLVARGSACGGQRRAAGRWRGRPAAPPPRHGPAPPWGGGTHARLDWALSPPEQRIRVSSREQ